MSFSNMLEILQEKNKGAIVLIKLGVFYIAIGKDAVFLNKELDVMKMTNIWMQLKNYLKRKYNKMKKTEKTINREQLKLILMIV